MNRRTARVLRSGGALAVVLPADWVRGNGVQAGDQVEVEYDGFVRVSLPGATGDSPRIGQRLPLRPGRQLEQTQEGGNRVG